MQKVVLLCKSYREDLFRARRLAESTQRFNDSHIPVYFSVPSQDLSTFQQTLSHIPCTFLTDETILKKTCQAYGDIPRSFPGHLLQQLVKLEFWRMNLCENYVWIDSDSYFIRPFQKDDFFYNENTPYTVCHDSEELRRFSKTYDPIVMQDFENMAKKFQCQFGRSGPYYNFGYPPIIWSCRILKSLYEDYLKKKATTIFQLLQQYPCEMQLYGEYLLYSKIVPMIPIDPLFKVFHYAEQFLESQMKGESEFSLSQHYSGIVMQSNWARLSKTKTMTTEIRHLLRRLRTRLGLRRS